MTTHDEIETRLRRAFEVSPSADGWGWLDQRVARAMARPAGTERRPFVMRPVFLRPAMVVAALVLLTGAVGAALSLLDRTVESSGTPGWQTAWDRAERLGIQETDAGVTITLERAYADLNQILVGFTVAGLEVPASAAEDPPAMQWTVELRDPAGRSSERWASSMTGMGVDETGLSAVVQTWEGDIAPMAGTWVLTFSSVGYSGDGFVPGQCTVGATDPECANPPSTAMVDGTWQFTYELPAPAGTILTPTDVSSTAGPATLRLTELRVTPTMVTARIGLSIEGAFVTTWSSIPVAVRHLDASYEVNSARAVLGGDPAEGNGETVFFTTAGSDAPAGTWTIEIPTITYQQRIGEEVRLNGPWTLTVLAP